MTWTLLALLAALGHHPAAHLFQAARRPKIARESWDEQIIGRLRSQGYAPFNDYPVDFFLALPDEAACQGVPGRASSRSSAWT